VVTVRSKNSGRPVNITMTRQEVFEGRGPTSATYARCTIGATRRGRLTAAQRYLAYEAGAFPGSPVGGGALTGLGPYTIDHLLVDGFDVVVNKPKVQAYRAPGQPQAAFAVECTMDELAETLGLDALELRLKNAVQQGDRITNGVMYPRIGCQELEEAMQAPPHDHTPLEAPDPATAPGRRRGRGLAVAHRFNSGQMSSAAIPVNRNGTINLITGSVDLSGSRVSIAMQAAEALGLRAADVNPLVVDTDSIAFTAGSGGSRITDDTGLAAIAAAEDVTRQMLARAPGSGRCSRRTWRSTLGPSPARGLRQTA
jgi:xanthine dehydrogenase molybdenum-binding subunit